ncbi:hypothetical protein WICMUC_001598 [Wickerhamomyces mucosus]|uniref:Small ribosomal subunit protein uS11m n=1 Tax=Wickerhamomyces mucosus TaxID=1378264 RepID=A0A9P8PTX6_9ASCO|nr:hypothetical protein WICMUC_001598 [Wickerhamomyces mucosus]
MLARIIPLRCTSVTWTKPLILNNFRAFAISSKSRQSENKDLSLESTLSFSGIVSNSSSSNTAGKSPNGEILSSISVSSPSSNASGLSPNSPLSELIHKYVLHCNFTKNNTHLTLTAVTEDLNFLKKNPNLSTNEKILYYYQLPEIVKISISTGALGFRKSARGEYEATFQTAAKMFQLMEDKGYLDKNIEIVFKNFGKGREAFIDAIKGKEGNMIRPHVVRLQDDTKLKFGGTRSPKTRRL